MVGNGEHAFWCLMVTHLPQCLTRNTHVTNVAGYCPFQENRGPAPSLRASPGGWLGLSSTGVGPATRTQGMTRKWLLSKSKAAMVPGEGSGEGGSGAHPKARPAQQASGGSSRTQLRQGSGDSQDRGSPGLLGHPQPWPLTPTLPVT